MADDSKKGGSVAGHALAAVASLLATASPVLAADRAEANASTLTIEQRVERIRDLVVVAPGEAAPPGTEPGEPPARVLQWPNWPNYWNNWGNWNNWRNWNNWANWYNG